MSSCREIMELCVQNCRYGYQLIPSSKVGECTSCLCQPGIDHIHDLIRTMTDNKNMIVILNWPFFLVLCHSKHYHAQNRINRTKIDIVFIFEYQWRGHTLEYFSSHNANANNIESDCPPYILSGWRRQLYDKLSLWLLPEGFRKWRLSPLPLSPT